MNKMSQQRESSLSTIGSWELDLIKNKLIWSDEVYRIFGLMPQEFEATYKAFLDRVHPDDCHAVDQAYTSSLREGRDSYEIQHRIIRKATGEIRWVHEKCMHFKDTKGKIIRSVGMVLDITERKLLEQRKDEFLSIASHELNTPIATIKAYAQILGQYHICNKDQSFASYLSKLEFQIDRLIELVNQLLDASKAQCGKLKLIKEKFNLTDLIKEIAEDLQQTAKGYHITVEGSIKKYIIADKHRIGQVLINLISNAIKYSPKSDKVIIKLASGSKNVKVSVKDFGIGIKKRNLDKIFERFYQVENRIRVSQGGLGLGLYISKQIIKEHNGEIWAESEKGKGSTFIFKLPVGNK